MCRAVASHGKEFAIALRVGLLREQHGVAGAGGRDGIQAQAGLAKPRQRRAGQRSAASSACGWVDDSEEAFFHGVFTRIVQQRRARVAPVARPERCA